MQQRNKSTDTPVNHVKPRLVQQSLEETSLSIQKERNVILWHDPSISSAHNQQMSHFLSIITEVKGFDDPDKLVKHITESKPANYSVITAGTKGEFLTKQVSDLLNVSAVYVFCGNVPFHSTWAKQFPKVALVESDPTRLIIRIFRDLRQRVTGHGSLRIDLPVFLETGEKGYKMRNSQLHKVTEMEDRNLAQKDLVYLGKHVSGDEAEIERFENEYMEYDMAKILKWYSESEVLARLASSCLKQGTPDAVYFGRYLLKDLGKAINESYWKTGQGFKGRVYRSMFITEDQWKKLKENEGKEMAFVDFFRATKVKEQAQTYLKIGIDLTMLVIIEIEGHPIEQGKGFAELAGDKQEVLFSAFTRFTVKKLNSKSVDGKEEDRELVLAFGGENVGQPVAQDVINFAQCMNCQSVLETGLEEVIDPTVHYTCNKCPKEHSVPVFEQKVEEEEGGELKAEGKMRERKKAQEGGVSEPNHSLLSKEIDIAKLAKLESVILPGKKEEDNLAEVFAPIKKEDAAVLESVIKPVKKEEEKVFAPVKEEQAASVVVTKKMTLGEDDDDEEEEEEEEDEEQGRLLELYLKAKEEFEWKNYGEAIRWYEEILKNPGKLDKILLGKCYSNLHASYEALGGKEKIVESLLRVLEEKKKIHGKDHAEVKATYKELAQLFAKLAVEE